ncbi:MAG: serine protease [Candidatus Woesearchaeota archaeon]|nr:serine protease [Candidatus Woesearchaeota archaeon]
MAQVEPIYLCTTMIIMLEDNQEKGSATGFFYVNTNNKLFLITNKHVVYGEKYYENPPTEINRFRLNLHINPNNLSHNEFVEVSLFDDKCNRLWLEHENPNVDVIILPVDIDRKRYIIAPLDKSLFDSQDLIINFEKIFVMGYPYGWYDRLNNLPISRIGHLSSPFDVDFNGQALMLGDVETHPGMSGGPVFIWLKDYTTKNGNNRTTHLGRTKIILAGVHSGQPRWDLIDSTTKTIKEIRHSLINVWNYRLINEIFSLNKI